MGSWLLPLDGGGWVGVRFAQCAIDCCPDSFGVAENIVIPKADYPISFLVDQARSPAVAWFTMLSTIDFNYQFRSMARKINNVVAYGYLSAESRFWKGLPQHSPDCPLCSRHVPPKSARFLRSAGRRVMLHNLAPYVELHPYPTLPHQAGGLADEWRLLLPAAVLSNDL
jgi:hypothetical protein